MSRSAQSTSLAVRCAIYTRKSSEEGLDQDFNSLHAQREACEAYVRSQIGEGWRLLPDAYDDGGCSGGNMERLGLKRLLTDIDHGKVDIVVVYKVDRLTRSLSDFAKIVDRFDAKGASFVSVTQSFNTTTSMGRLTLNMLLSFAQFEREVTGERIRDKIAASKRKGMWMGGSVPLGYEVRDRTLVVNAPEAEQVRAIFRRYLEVKSVHRLAEQLTVEGVRSKQRTTIAGNVMGGAVIRRGALFYMLSNRLYLGQIVHKDEAFPGLHPPIVDEDTFAQVQALLDEGRKVRRMPSMRRQASPLMGKLFDEDGRPMSPTISYGRGGKRYRYYVSTTLQTGGRTQDGDALKRLPGAQIETYLSEQLRRLLGIADGIPDCEVLGQAKRVQVHAQSVAIHLPLGDHRQHSRSVIAQRLADTEQLWSEEDGEGLVVSLPVRLKFRGGRSWRPAVKGGAQRRAQPDPTLIEGLRKAHRVMASAACSPTLSPSNLVRATSPADPYLRRLGELVFLSPQLQAAILCGKQPPGLTLHALMAADVPLRWANQNVSNHAM